MDVPKIVVMDAEELQSLVESAVRRAIGTGQDDWVDARTSGLGRRTFLRLAREGAFPVSKLGKRYVARRADIGKHLEQQRARAQGQLEQKRARVRNQNGSATAETPAHSDEREHAEP